MVRKYYIIAAATKPIEIIDSFIELSIFPTLSVHK